MGAERGRFLRETGKVLKVLIKLTVVMALTYIKIQQIVPVKLVSFLVHQLYLNEAVMCTDKIASLHLG